MSCSTNNWKTVLKHFEHFNVGQSLCKYTDLQVDDDMGIT